MIVLKVAIRVGVFAYIGNEALQATRTILDTKFGAVFLEAARLCRVVATVKEASDGVAVNRRDPEVGRASVQHNGEGLRGSTDINFTIVLEGGRVRFWKQYVLDE